MAWLTTFFRHAQAVRAAAAALNLDVAIHLGDYGLRIADGARAETWRPKFIGRVEDQLVYTESPIKGAFGFAGWMPYAMRQWPIALDKSAFKRHAIAQGVPTPAACFNPSLIGGPFIIKKASSSFGAGMRGPFLAYDAGDPDQQLAEGEYYENFLVGLIAKAWCWGGQCAALHLHPPAVVVGNGSVTVRELVLQLRDSRAHADHDWPLIERLVRYCELDSVKDVVPEGKEVLVEYRYGSRYEQPSLSNPNAWPSLKDSDLRKQFTRAAQVFSQAISDEPQLHHTLYTLDAIVDDQGVAWFLEMNCNPLVHPDVYGCMLAGSFDPPLLIAQSPPMRVDSRVEFAPGKQLRELP